MRVYAKTDIGKAREMNQDFYYVSQLNENMQLCILADGMGGYKGGEIASSLATNSAREYIEKKFELIKHSDEEIMNLIKESMEYANEIVYDKAKANEELEQMGTTLEVCLLYNEKAYIGHIGDSRIYRIRKNIIRRITTDHSYVEKLVKDGTITREEAFYHPKKNMLMKALRMQYKYRARHTSKRIFRKRHFTYVFRWTYKYANRRSYIQYSSRKSRNGM